MDTVKFGEVELVLGRPIPRPVEWIGSRELMDQILACWTMVTRDDLAMCPRIVGKPGMGKTTLAQAAGQAMQRAVYIYQCTMDTRPEDLLVTPVLSDAGRISYHASALVTAMIRGGVVILDEANRMSEKSWASLAPLLDNRRYVESLVAGIRVEAHHDFRCCVTMNDDASTYEVPEYIISRLQPMVELDYPSRDDEMLILAYNVDFSPHNLVEMTADFLTGAHKFRLGYTTRDGINIMRYALKLENGPQKMDLEQAFHQAVEQVLGPGAEDLEAKARGPFMMGNAVDFSQFFTTQEDLEEGDDEV